ncbi:MAG: GNAT family N-acetyltransferase [Candidatus Thiodiazotropha sp. (ex Dulcina madagascariensis)]|nr:GNAT family N-acetyltransferase [Candidatus Thiodiazotropha sp. (ex Dulcina madagascariensis)]
MSTASQYQIIAADASHFNGIVQLIQSPEELFLIHPGGTWPFDTVQLQQLSKARSDFTVVMDQDTIIGFANLYRNLSGDRLFIGNVVVSDSYRGQGVGRRLICHMCDIIFDRYASEVHISVFNFNTPALLLYASLGFKPYDLERRRMPNGDYSVLIHMRLYRRTW